MRVRGRFEDYVTIPVDRHVSLEHAAAAEHFVEEPENFAAIAGLRHPMIGISGAKSCWTCPFDTLQVKPHLICRFTYSGDIVRYGSSQSAVTPHDLNSAL